MTDVMIRINVTGRDHRIALTRFQYEQVVDWQRLNPEKAWSARAMGWTFFPWMYKD